MDKSIFISKNKENIGELLHFAKQKGIRLVAHSFLQFSKIDFTIQSPFDCIFFGSPRAVSYFLASETISQGIKIACVGKGTAKALQEEGYSVQFTGESSDSSVVAKEFKRWCKNDTVLFPISTISLKTISSIFPDNKKEELVVYATQIIPKTISPCEIYVFTSPSNVKGFFEKNTLAKGVKVIAWGSSTEKALHEIGRKCIVLKEGSVAHLIEVLIPI